MPYLSPRIFSNGNEPQHNIKIVDNIVPQYPGHVSAGAQTSIYQYKLVCSCQFEVLCRTMAEAESWRASHLALHNQQAAVEVGLNYSLFDPNGSGNPHSHPDNQFAKASANRAGAGTSEKGAPESSANSNS